MKKKLPFITILIVFILVISVSYYFNGKHTLGNYEEDYVSKILVDNQDIQVIYKNGNLFNTNLTYGNVFEKVIDIKNESLKDVTLSINIRDLKDKVESVKYLIYYKIDDEEYKILKEESTIDDKLIYNLISYKNTDMSIKIVIKSYFEGNKNLSGEFKVDENISSKEIFISNMNEIHSKLLDKINSLNGINQSGIYFYTIEDDSIKGQVIIDAQDISEVKYIYTAYNDLYMYVNYKYDKEFKKSKIQKNDFSLNNITPTSACSSYSKKACVSFSSLQYDETGGKENFYNKVNEVIKRLDSINISENVYIINVVDDLNIKDIRGYVLINNKENKREIYLYLTNNIFMISGYNLTSLGSIDINSSTIRAYKESAFNLSSKDMHTVCSFSGFNECLTLQNNPV